MPGPAAGRPASARLVIAPGDTASAAYMVRHALDAGGAPVVELDSRVDPPAGSAIPPAPSLAVVVRYLPRRWLRWVAGLRGQGVPVVYFMDDDLMDPDAVAELPEPYRTRVRRDALRQRKRIEAVCTAFWVSTPQLARKYAPWQPRVVDPRPPRASLLAEPPVWVCYHGSASHRAELDWLLPVMQQVQARAPAVRFEVFGDHAVYARFRALPRVNVLHPMSWPNYLDYTSGTRRDIALAPLLPSRFNAGRGPTKFLDFSRMHAVGLYADLEPYRGFVRDGLDGLLLPPDPLAWVQAVVGLAADAPRRARLAAAARERALALAY